MAGEVLFKSELPAVQIHKNNQSVYIRTYFNFNTISWDINKASVSSLWDPKMDPATSFQNTLSLQTQLCQFPKLWTRILLNNVLV